MNDGVFAVMRNVAVDEQDIRAAHVSLEIEITAHADIGDDVEMPRVRVGHVDAG